MSKPGRGRATRRGYFSQLGQEDRDSSFSFVRNQNKPQVELPTSQGIAQLLSNKSRAAGSDHTSLGLTHQATLLPGSPAPCDLLKATATRRLEVFQGTLQQGRVKPMLDNY